MLVNFRTVVLACTAFFAADAVIFSTKQRAGTIQPDDDEKFGTFQFGEHIEKIYEEGGKKHIVHKLPSNFDPNDPATWVHGNTVGKKKARSVFGGFGGAFSRLMGGKKADGLEEGGEKKKKSRKNRFSLFAKRERTPHAWDQDMLGIPDSDEGMGAIQGYRGWA